MKRFFIFLCSLIGLTASGANNKTEPPRPAAPVQEVFAAPPTVCAVGSEYQIMIPVNVKTIMWCQVGDRTFYDDSNGIMRSETDVHRIVVPQELLNKAGKYTIYYRQVFKRLPYFSKVSEPVAVEYNFKGIPADAKKIRIYQIADAHSHTDRAVAAGTFWGDSLDLFIMNGDIPEDCGTLKHIAAVYQISGQVTNGGVPVLFARGNHDMRGVLAEKFAENTPSYQGKTYYTFRLGPIWGVILDGGEDKVDSHPAYAHTICSHDFRLRQAEFLKDIIANAATEYNADGIALKLVVCHIPFAIPRPKAPFNIDVPLFKQWSDLLKDNVKPDVMLSGHIHRTSIRQPDDPGLRFKAACPVITGSHVDRENKILAGCALEWTPGNLKVLFTDQDKKVLGEHTLTLPKR